MKLTDIKAQIDAYFKSANPDEIIARFESMGCEFEDIDIFVKQSTMAKELSRDVKTTLKQDYTVSTNREYSFI